MYFFPAKLRRRSECGGPWTEDEWISLIDMHSNNVSLEDIANNLSRTIITIRFAIKEIPSNLHNHKKVSLQSKQEKIKSPKFFKEVFPNNTLYKFSQAELF